MTMCASAAPPPLLSHCSTVASGSLSPSLSPPSAAVDPTCSLAGIRKKCSKPLIEKRRRERINRCLSELQGLLAADGATTALAPAAGNGGGGRGALVANSAVAGDERKPSQVLSPQSAAVAAAGTRGKLEKADILELTVKHLRLLRRIALAGCRELGKADSMAYPQLHQQQQQQQQQLQEQLQPSSHQRQSQQQQQQCVPHASAELCKMSGAASRPDNEGRFGVVTYTPAASADARERSCVANAPCSADGQPSAAPAYLVLDGCGGAFVASAAPSPSGGSGVVGGGDGGCLPALASWVAAASAARGGWQPPSAAAAAAAAVAAAAACRGLSLGAGDRTLDAWRLWAAEATEAHLSSSGGACDASALAAMAVAADAADAAALQHGRQLWRPW